METREDIASALITQLFDEAADDLVIETRFAKPTEVTFIVHFLNGPGADLVMNAGPYRWLSVRDSDLDTIRTIGDFHSMCATHIVPDGA